MISRQKQRISLSGFPGAAYYDRKWLDRAGRLRLLPASAFLSVPPEHRMLWCNLRARYGLPTTELVDFLAPLLAGRRALEIGAGNGDLGYHLGIPETDSFIQQTPALRSWYAAQGQAPTAPAPRVLRMDVDEAVRTLCPEVVVGSWITEKFLPGKDQEGLAKASVYGPDEEDLLCRVQMYIHIGADHIHGEKRLLSRPHETVRLPGLVSRTADQSVNVIHIWRTT